MLRENAGVGGEYGMWKGRVFRFWAMSTLENDEKRQDFQLTLLFWERGVGDTLGMDGWTSLLKACYSSARKKMEERSRFLVAVSDPCCQVNMGCRVRWSRPLVGGCGGPRIDMLTQNPESIR